MNWTREHIKELKHKGKIRGYVDHGPKEQIIRNIQNTSKRSKEKDWMGWNLLYWCNEQALQLQEEYRFHVERKWRFDWCIPALKIGIEYNGIMSEKSRHTSIKGYSGDMRKITEASKQGWTILQYTPLNYKQVIGDLNDILKSKI